MTLKSITSKPEKLTWDAILPCPFCSGDGKVLTCTSLWDENNASSCCVICDTCGSGGPLIEPEDYMLVVEIEKLAIKKWNRRGNLAGAEQKLRRIAMILNQNQHFENN